MGWALTGIRTGISMGGALAMILSYVKWKSILWAIAHGVFGWFYVIYFAITYSGQ